MQRNELKSSLWVAIYSTFQFNDTQHPNISIADIYILMHTIS